MKNRNIVDSEEDFGILLPKKCMENLFLLNHRITRSVSPENISGEKGKGGSVPLENGSARFAAEKLGTGWKVNPYVVVSGGETAELANVQGCGYITHIWLTPTGNWRNLIIRFYWDDSDIPSVECPIGDFFACGWGIYAQISSLAVCVNPGSALNCYWKMPFRKSFRVTLENRSADEIKLYYQITYDLCELPESFGYFHAFFNRVNPLPYKEVYTVLDGIQGSGQYVGTYMTWGSNNSGWWGEGEIKFYMDGDSEYPTICGTGTEDYFCGSYNFEDPVTHNSYRTFTTPYTGLPQVLEPDRLYCSQFRFGMYRWHIQDSIRFHHDMKVTIQALGWRKSIKQYLPLQDDISSVAYFYLDHPCQNIPALPDPEYLEIN